MVTKVVTENDVDGVTIIINPQNKLEAKIPPSNAGSVEIEELIVVLNSSIIGNDRSYPITKVGRIKGTNWLVFQAEGLFNTTTTPPSTDETRTELVIPSISIPSGSDWIKDGNYYVGYNVTITLDKPLPDQATFDVELYMNGTLIKTVPVFSNGDTTFRISSGVTSTRISADGGDVPGGEVRIVNVQNAVDGNTTYHFAHTSRIWVGYLL